MKKILFWTAIAAFATISCTETDSLDELSKNPISFDTSVGKSNRAIINGTVYPTTEIFGVTAFYKTTIPFPHGNQSPRRHPASGRLSCFDARTSTAPAWEPQVLPTQRMRPIR